MGRTLDLVFERFADAARRVVVHAVKEARLLNHNYVGTEHLLLGLIRESDGVAARALESLDISLPSVRAEVEEIIGFGGQSPTGHIPFSPRAKKILDLSLREALQLGNDYVGTEHILLGLVREGEGIAAQVLLRLGADLSRVRRCVTEILADDRGSDSATRPDIEFRDDPNDILGERGMHGLFRSQGGLYRVEPRTRKERLVWACRRRVPNFMYGWPTWFRNRRASGLRGIPGDLAYLRDTLRGRFKGD